MRSAVLFALVAIAAGCNEAADCSSGAPSVVVDIHLEDRSRAAEAHSLVVALELGSKRYTRAFAADSFGDGETSIPVLLDVTPPDPFVITVTVDAYTGEGGAGASIARGTQSMSAKANGCNTLSVTLKSGGMDGGAGDADAEPAEDVPAADAGDAGVDTGVEDTGIIEDTGVTDTGLEDTGLEDTGLEDTGAIDMGFEDTGVVDTGFDDTGVVDTGVVDTGVVDTGIVDTGVADTGVPDTGVMPTAFNYVPSNFDPTAIPAGFDVQWDCGITLFNSSTGAFMNACGFEPPATVITQGGIDTIVISIHDLELSGTLRISGTRPVILAVFGEAQITGTIDASAELDTPGAGGSLLAQCTGAGTGVNGGSNMSGGGGGGGGFGSPGASGGDGAPGDLGGAGGPDNSMEMGALELTPLRGGCSGGTGGGNASLGDGGGGGGAVQISTALDLDLAGATILAGGGGGLPGERRSGAGGGGSGGAILLEGELVTIGSSSLISALGGGGGEGGSESNGEPANPGENASASPTTGGAGGGGGTATGGNGGHAATLLVTPMPGFDGISGRAGGGGGGGGLGRVRINSNTTCVISSPVLPNATSNGRPGCP